MKPVNRTFMSSSSSYRGWAIAAIVLAFAFLPAATPASRHASTWGEILIAGGRCLGFDPLASAELYDPASNRFMKAKMKASRARAVVVLINRGSDAGKVLITGGDGRDFCPLASTELYDPATNSFARGPAMRAARVDHTATVLAAGPHAGEVLIVGGSGWGPQCNGPVALASTELYDPAKRVFAPGPRLRAGRQGHTATPIVSGPNRGEILIAGGTDSNFHPLASTELYDPWSNQLLAGPSMNLPRAEHTATVIVAGRNSGGILIAGGYDGRTGPLAATELFDPVSIRFLPGPNMKTARERHTATVIDSGPKAGRILIAGGDTTDDEQLSSTELFNPDPAGFSPGPAMNWSRFGHTATVIESGPKAGRIMISGGTGPSSADPAGFSPSPGMNWPPFGHTTPVVETAPNSGRILVTGGPEDPLSNPNDLYDPATNSFAPEGYVPSRDGGCFDTFAIQLPPGPPHDSHR